MAQEARIVAKGKLGGLWSLPWIFKADKGKGDGAPVVLQLNVSDLPIFEE